MEPKEQKDTPEFKIPNFDDVRAKTFAAEDKPLATGSCFWGHQWGKWEQFERDMVNITTGAEFVQGFQKKYCVRCNKMRQERV